MGNIERYEAQKTTVHGVSRFRKSQGELYPHIHSCCHGPIDITGRTVMAPGSESPVFVSTLIRSTRNQH